MKEATQKEEYERAAEIRDQILALEKRLPHSEVQKPSEARQSGEAQGGA
jgi:excinuclease UvrABC nuclease subunit